MANPRNDEHRPAPVTAVTSPASNVTCAQARLAPLTPSRQRAIRFAIETGLTLAEVTEIGWKAAFKVARSRTARRILREQPLHPKLPYVFWENTDPNGRCVGPLFRLERDVQLLLPEYRGTLVA